MNTSTFQLTRSVGSVTGYCVESWFHICISTHTLRGERDIPPISGIMCEFISTHTLRGERDAHAKNIYLFTMKFQLTRSVGSVTYICTIAAIRTNISTHTLRGERDTSNQQRIRYNEISTHTLRGERDWQGLNDKAITKNFNSHAPWGA